ncbi:hypothetical protein RA263_22600 [Pseudomonas syringae pv. tagetis]|uniref:Uncharacterized protein n=1 Tax=Pseudomonas syringae pv. tagetis TaxID=129140 RepID=A0ABW7NSI2_9PSED|nr:hypothetical protein [Pseudomonas syringae group genomosp. 7]RMW11725.1 hypothetical protein ALO98_200396 [Pseudomonas syringae pv. tagetis]RMW24985.1 hypothetical protein ALO97_200095 [Pseudomonas syringae pv. tagetis]UNB68477.1 hypothetical protein MME58_25475 [Pseudomonas syringae pv. tagetis]
MIFNDFLPTKNMFSVGIEETSERFYASIPVSNGMVDYEIDKTRCELFQKDSEAVLVFVITCRHRKMDDLLILQSGTNREIAI